MELPTNKILLGDSLSVLKTLPDESVDCCITSPPYWGLRDYGTATWEGGDEKCDHAIPESEIDPKNPESGSHIARFNRDSCFRCGAKRIDAQIGLEKTPEEYVATMVGVFHEVKRILKKEGTLWLNLGDTYSAARWNSGTGQPMNKFRDTHRSGKETEERESNLPEKNLVGIPWRVAFALQADGWYLRQDIIWAKPNPMPESVTDRCTKSHEYIFLLSKSPQYYFDNEAIKEDTLTFDDGIRDRDNTRLNNTPGRTKMAGLVTNNYEKRNKRSVWTITTHGFPEAHFATFPEDLVVPMVKAGCPPSGIVLDPFAGASTTLLVAKKLGRHYLGIELNPDYVAMGEARLRRIGEPLFTPPVIPRNGGRIAPLQSETDTLL